MIRLLKLVPPRFLPDWAIKLLIARCDKRIKRLEKRIEAHERRKALVKRIQEHGWNYMSLEQMELASELGLKGAKEIVELLRKYPGAASP